MGILTVALTSGWRPSREQELAEATEKARRKLRNHAQLVGRLGLMLEAIRGERAPHDLPDLSAAEHHP